MATMKLKATIAHDKTEIFPSAGRYTMWRKGEITSPKWLKRQNGYDFVQLTTAKEMEDFKFYLSRKDERQCVEFYNVFSTGKDKDGNKMIVLYDQDEDQEQTKRCIVIIRNDSLVDDALLAIDEYCDIDF